MTMDFVPGWVAGFVTNNEDPTGQCRVKFSVPGLIEPESNFWAYPVFPGGGSLNKGSKYPPPDPETPIYIMFEQGRYMEPTARAIYMSGYYGDDNEGVPATPLASLEAASALEANRRVIVWENDTFSIYVTDDDHEKRAVIQSKVSGSKIELRADDGQAENSETVTLEARTAIRIFSYGLINIDGRQVKINGRVVSRQTRESI